MAKKEEIEALRSEIADNMTENSEGHFYCDECDWMIVMPGGSHGRCATSDGHVELVQHDVDCSFTAKRVLLGLELPLEREIETLRWVLANTENELSTNYETVAELREEIESMRKRLRLLEAKLAEEGKVKK